ncbi:MAG TPA: lipoprotein [Candidimonas sp.]|nr:lipoprotein [Candidimonas sp.]
MHATRAHSPGKLFFRLAGSIALLSSLLACGYKGPLYMPPPPAPDASLTTPPQPSTPPKAE